MAAVRRGDAVCEVHPGRGGGHEDGVEAVVVRSYLPPSGQGDHFLIQQQAVGSGAEEENPQHWHWSWLDITSVSAISLLSGRQDIMAPGISPLSDMGNIEICP